MDKDIDDFGRAIVETQKTGIATAWHKLECGHTHVIMGCGWNAKVGEKVWCRGCSGIDKLRNVL